MYALALASYPDAIGVYLFYCGADWQVMTDTFHDNTAAALAQAGYVRPAPVDCRAFASCAAR